MAFSKTNFLRNPVNKSLVYMARKLNSNFMLQNSNSIFTPCRVYTKDFLAGFLEKFAFN